MDGDGVPWRAMLELVGDGERGGRRMVANKSPCSTLSMLSLWGLGVPGARGRSLRGVDGRYLGPQKQR